MKKVLILSAMLIALSLPALAWQLNFTENFEGYWGNQSGVPTALEGQGGWITPNGAYTDTTMVVNNAQNHTVGGAKSAEQIVSTTLYSSNAKDMRPHTTLDPNHGYGVGFSSGFAKFWVYEKGNSGALLGSNTRVGVVGDGEGISEPDNPYTGGVANSSFTANISSSVGGFWRAQWASDVRTLDGTAAATTTGYKWIPYASAPRKTTPGWSYVIVTWGFDYAANTGFGEWRINRSTANMRVEFTGAAGTWQGRWKATSPITGLFIGDATVKTQSAGGQLPIDDIEFHGNVVPEPTSLLALGTGMIGLLGLIRRKR